MPHKKSSNRYQQRCHQQNKKTSSNNNANASFLLTLPKTVTLLSLVLLHDFLPSSLCSPLPHTPRQRRRRRRAAKLADGPPTEIDCSSLSTTSGNNNNNDFSYYIERCYDDTTQWWINGHCIDGRKDEVSELYPCGKSDGTRAYCHDCIINKDNGNMESSSSVDVKHVCGSDSPNYEEVCSIARGDVGVSECGEHRLKVYSHQCGVMTNPLDEDKAAEKDESTTQSSSWYLRESYYCAESEIYATGPNSFTCGHEWYYEFEEEEHDSGEEHPFANADHVNCLDCGMGIQVCAKNEDATCESLGLPPRGTVPEGLTTSSANTKNNNESNNDNTTNHHRSAWKTHGTLGILTFGLFVPLAILCPLLVPTYYYWTYIVGCINIITFASTLITVSTAISTMESMMGNADEGHLKEVHHIVGLLLLLLVCFQMVNGFPLLWFVLFGLGAYQVKSGLGLYAARYDIESNWGQVYTDYVFWASVVIVLAIWKYRKNIRNYDPETEIQMGSGGGSIGAIGDAYDAEDDLMEGHFESRETIGLKW